MPKQIVNSFKPNQKQRQLLELLSTQSPYILAYGGSRGGKSVGIAFYLIKMCLASPGTRVGVFRQTRAECQSNLFDLTFPQTMGLAFPGLWEELSDNGLPGSIHQSDLVITFSNGSKILFGGLDDPTRVDKILGQELHTVWLNEATSIAYQHYSKLISRLSGHCVVTDREGNLRELPQRIICDCNPTTKQHWLFKQFIGHWTDGIVGGERNPINPDSNILVRNPQDYAVIKIHTADNIENLPKSYMDKLADMSPADQKRYLEGEWTDTVDGALFQQKDIDDNRQDITQEDLIRITVNVDPAISSHAGSDETGITVTGLHEDGTAYVLADLSLKGPPAKWAKAVVDAYHHYQADCVVAEINQGGDMVEDTIRQHDPNVSYKGVRATRGKTIRAEPISKLYADGKVHHPTKGLAILEDQMTRFHLSYNRNRDGSPDRLDSLVWGLTDLMVKEVDAPAKVTHGRIALR